MTALALLLRILDWLSKTAPEKAGPRAETTGMTFANQLDHADGS